MDTKKEIIDLKVKVNSIEEEKITTKMSEDKDDFIKEFDKLVKEKATKSGKSIGAYYKRIINYCKQRVG